MRNDLPSGTVTFLFTDVEGSTRLLHELGAERYAEALAEHRRLIREACTANGGVEVDTQGDAFFVAFPTAPGAFAAGVAMTEALSPGPIQVRMGLHTGTPHLADEGYVGGDVHRAARIAACGHGGQLLVSAATASLLGGEGLRDLGEHRLKDLSAPERIYQLGADDFPPLKSLHQTNLPIPSSPFLGREQELAQVLGLLSQDVRLLTLTGPGGTGKTRLALQVAGAVADRYPHGVWWVPLAALRDPELVLEAAAQELGAKDGLSQHVADRSLLLLLDNFEHVVEAADHVAGLLGSCPNLTVLVTSREPLRVTGEQEYAVPPLAHEEGVELFLARARAVRPDFEVDEAVADICRRLDQLPLALELAAARVKALSARQILERLEQRLPLLTGGARDLPKRQRTLRAAIEWSYELLSLEEQRRFGQLAVFRGGCTVESAEEVVGADLDMLQSLVDKSLVRHTEEQFWMLETIREYAAERLEESGEAEELRRRHAEYFLALAEEAQPHLWKGRVGELLDRLEAEHDNFRAAFDHLESSGETQLALRLTAALWRFWNLRGPLPEGSRRLESALAADERPTAARAGALTGAAAMAARSGDAATARSRAEEALALNRALGDAWSAALSQSYIATSAAEERDWARAQTIAAECARAFRELGDEHYAMLATWLLSWMCRELGERERSRALTDENLRRSRALGHQRVEAMSLDALAMLAVDEGRLQDALAMLKEAYRIHCDVGERLGIALDLCRFARALAAEGRVGMAARLLSTGAALREEIGATVESWPAMEAKLEETLTTVRAQLDEAAFAEAWEQGRTLTADEAVALALDSGA